MARFHPDLNGFEQEAKEEAEMGNEIVSANAFFDTPRFPQIHRLGKGITSSSHFIAG
jgi:hypothetical protein